MSAGRSRHPTRLRRSGPVLHPVPGRPNLVAERRPGRQPHWLRRSARFTSLPRHRACAVGAVCRTARSMACKTIGNSSAALLATTAASTVMNCRQRQSWPPPRNSNCLPRRTSGSRQGGRELDRRLKHFARRLQRGDREGVEFNDGRLIVTPVKAKFSPHQRPEPSRMRSRR